jgi:PEGA domain
MPRLQAFIPAVLLLFAGLGLPAPAAATESPENSQRVAIFRLEFSGNVAQPLRDSLAIRLVEGLTTVGFEVIRPAAGGAVVAELRDGRCDRPECLRTIADKLQARYLVGAKVEENAKTFEITLELVTGQTGVVTGTSRERCEICGAEEVGEKLSLAAAGLRSRLLVLARAPARFVIRTRPHGAAIQIDDKPAGKTPVDLSLAAGPHHMSIEREGFSPLDRSFIVTSGVDETLDLELVRLPSPFPFRAAGWAALTAGTLLAAGGAYLLRIDGREVGCGDDLKDGGGRCPRIYKTNVAGAALLGLSAVSATLGGVWLFLAPPYRMSVERSAFTVGASGRF